MTTALERYTKYTAVYYRLYSKCIEEFDSYEEAAWALWCGSQENYLSPEYIMGPNGEKLPMWLYCNKKIVSDGKIYECIDIADHFPSEEHNYEEVAPSAKD